MITWETDENGRIQLMHSINPTAIMDTQYGYVDGSTWLELEKERIDRKEEGCCEIKTRDDGRLELWVVPASRVGPAFNRLDQGKLHS